MSLNVPLRKGGNRGRGNFEVNSIGARGDVNCERGGWDRQDERTSDVIGLRVSDLT